MIAAIWAQTSDGLIGLNGGIPWRYSGDMRRFRRVTSGAAVIMGRKTFESIGNPLPNRMNIVLTSDPSGFACSLLRAGKDRPLAIGGGNAPSWEVLPAAISEATDAGHKDVWFIGGARIYEAALALTELDIVDVTYVPDTVDVPFGADAVYAPKVDESVFAPGELLQHEDEPALKRRVYVRRTLAEAPYDDASNRRLQELGILRRRP